MHTTHFKVILLTSPLFLNGEADTIRKLFEIGLEILHIRKPHASSKELEELILSIPKPFRHKIVLHSHFDLVNKLGLLGAHISSRRPIGQSDFNGQLSYSCHSFSDVECQKANCEYVFLSPIHNSISKEGYHSAFTRSQLQHAHNIGLIDHKVIALGGITPAHVQELCKLGFGGIAVLGDIWQSRNPLDRFKQYLAMQSQLSQ